MKQLTLTMPSAVVSSISARLSSQNLKFSPVIKSVLLKYCLHNRPIFPLCDIHRPVFLTAAKKTLCFRHELNYPSIKHSLGL